MTLLQALKTLGRSYEYIEEDGYYNNIKCCGNNIVFECFLGCIDYGKCLNCNKSITRKALLNDECFITE